MTQGRKTGGKDFKKGKSGNPGGKSKAAAELQKARNLTKEELTEILNLVTQKPRTALEEIRDNPETTYLISWTLKIALDGGLGTWALFLDRMVGRVKEAIEHSVDATLEDLIVGSMGKGDGKNE